MNRPIKFRVWWPQSDGNGGRLMNNPRIEFKHLNQIFDEMKDWTFMQFTGLTDKNGKEIYEGDILVSGRGKPYPVIVEWQNRVWSHPGFGVFDKSRDSELNIYHFASEGEVIGNIYENPELLSV